MLDPKLVDYVSRYLRSGYSPDQVRQTLLNAGWPSDMVDEAIRQETSRVSPVPTPKTPVHPDKPQEKPPQEIQRSPGVLRKLPGVLLHPGQFFELMKTEQGYEAPLKFHVLLIVMHLVIFNISFFFLANQLLELILSSSLLIAFGFEPMLLLISMLYANLAIIGSIVITFIWAGILHLFVKLFRGKRGYLETYKLVLYASTPGIALWASLLLMMVDAMLSSAVFMVLFAWMLLIEFRGLKKLQGLSTGRAIGVVITPFIIVAVLIGLIVMFFATVSPNPPVPVIPNSAYNTNAPTGFTSLLAPSEWDVSSNGDLSITLSNRLSSEVTIYSIMTETELMTDAWSTEGCSGPETYLTIASAGTADLSTACPNIIYSLNLGPHTAGSTYSVEILIFYNDGELDDIEREKLKGIVS